MNTEPADNCRICGHTQSSDLETHHVVPQRYGGSDAPENLVTLCGSCHNALENIYDDRFYARLGIAAGRPAPSATEDELGHQMPEVSSPDRQFPEHPLHVSQNTLHVETILANEWASAEQLAKYAVPYSEHPEFDLEEAADDIAATDEEGEMRLREVPVLHCGYCDRFFFEWEQNKCRTHLRVAHRISHPFAEETEWTSGVQFDSDGIKHKTPEKVPKSHPSVNDGYDSATHQMTEAESSANTLRESKIENSNSGGENSGQSE